MYQTVYVKKFIYFEKNIILFQIILITGFKMKQKTGSFKWIEDWISSDFSDYLVEKVYIKKNRINNFLG